MNKIRKGDEVIVITGKDKGKRGVVLALRRREANVEGPNLVKKHVKPNPMKGTTGGVEGKTMPLHFERRWSTRMARRRVGIKVEEGKKVRFLSDRCALSA